MGDHIWADVVRSKKAIGWRTLLVIPELDAELEVLAGCKVRPWRDASMQPWGGVGQRRAGGWILRVCLPPASNS